MVSTLTQCADQLTLNVQINSIRIGHGHIKNWNSEWNDWEWDGESLRHMDIVFASAAERGVRLIFPLLNADFGSTLLPYIIDRADAEETSDRRGDQLGWVCILHGRLLGSGLMFLAGC